MIRNTFVLAFALLLSATSASMAFTHQHHHLRRGLYDVVPHHAKGGPGPRVENGKGAGAGAESGSAR